jgi:hypothetical protein
LTGAGEDFDGSIAQYAWDYHGDGIYDYTSADDPVADRVYPAPGLYNAKLRVTDDLGAWDVDTVAVQVMPPGENLPPVITAFTVTPDEGFANLSVDFHVDAFDPDGTIAEIAWDLNDDGFFSEPGLSPDKFWVFGPGLQKPRVRVTDNEGASTIAHQLLYVDEDPVNHPPVAELNCQQERIVVAADGSASELLYLDASFSYDIDGDPLSYSFYGIHNDVDTFDVDDDGDGEIEVSYSRPGNHLASVTVNDGHGNSDIGYHPVEVSQFSSQIIETAGGEDMCVAGDEAPGIAYVDAPAISMAATGARAASSIQGAA